MYKLVITWFVHLQVREIDWFSEIVDVKNKLCYGHKQWYRYE